MKRGRERDSAPALDALFDMPVVDFFARHWEQGPLVVKGAQHRLALWTELPNWESTLGVLLNAACIGGVCEPLVLKDQHPTSAYPSTAAAYLDGCSIVVNHAEEASPAVAQLCRDLRRVLPHAFANIYLTPPDGRAVDAHADDRDVIVLQLAGAKSWKVFPPPDGLAFPVEDEQVGKAGRAVPASAVRAGRESMVRTLRKGDVMYVPRGFVHEAATGKEGASLHLTLALPSHDWSWAALAARAVDDASGHARDLARDDGGGGSGAGQGVARSDGASLLRELRAREQPADDARGRWFWRRAVPPALVCPAAGDARAVSTARHLAAAVELELGLACDPGSVRDDAAADGAAEATDGVISRHLRLRAALHNARQDERVGAGAQKFRHEARSAVAPSSWVRRLHAHETAPVAERSGGADGAQETDRGLVAREEIADALMVTLARLTTEPTRVSSFDDAPLLCELGKACFAQVCIDLGLLLLCDADGRAYAQSLT